MKGDLDFMSDGKSLRILGDWIASYFSKDKYGSLVPSKNFLRTEDAALKVNELMAKDHDLERLMTRKIFSTDVEFAYRPEGSTPVIVDGIRHFGPSPLRNLKFEDKDEAISSYSTTSNKRETNYRENPHKTKADEFQKECKKRARKITAFVQNAISTLKELQPKNEAEKAILEVEMDQVKTGGGYDNTEAMSITNSLLDYLDKCFQDIDFEDGRLSEMLMRHCLKFREELWRDLGLTPGSLRITSFELVRMMQESDGMIGFPLYKKSSANVTKTDAVRMSMWSGVDVRFMSTENAPIIKQMRSLQVECDKMCEHFKTSNKRKFSKDELNDEVKKITEQYRKRIDVLEEQLWKCVDLMCYILDHIEVTPESAIIFALIWTLARIQRHGYKFEDNELVAKKGKARSVSPNGALSAAEEAMTGDSFIRAMKEAKVPWMPSLQDRKTADQLIWNWYESVLVPKNMRALPADWSGYDKTVKGGPLATILYYVVRPLFHFDDQKWVDLAIVSLTYKYFFVSSIAANSPNNKELWEKIKQEYDVYPLGKFDKEINDYPFYLVGTYNGLGSGAKLTHVGGSLYGELIIHHCIAEMLGYEGVSGPQAGDDTSLAVPENMIDITSSERTYEPISRAAAEWGLDLNHQKQMWIVGGGEVMNIFLQYDYNYNLQIKGVGTAARYYVAYPFAEREKFLTVGEQYLAVISKFNNGVSNPWIKVWVKKWLDRDDYICAIFKEYGDKAFNDVIVASIGSSLKEASERLEITYNWGLTQEELTHGDIPVLPIIVEVAKECSPKVTATEAIAKLGLLEKLVQTAKEEGGYDTAMDTDNEEPESDDDSSDEDAAD